MGAVVFCESYGCHSSYYTDSSSVGTAAPTLWVRRLRSRDVVTVHSDTASKKPYPYLSSWAPVHTACGEPPPFPHGTSESPQPCAVGVAPKPALSLRRSRGQPLLVLQTGGPRSGDSSVSQEEAQSFLRGTLLYPQEEGDVECLKSTRPGKAKEGQVVSWKPL